MQRDNLTLSQLFDALTTAHLSLVELDTTNGKNLSAFLSEVRDDTYHDISLSNVEADETYGNVKQEMALIREALDNRFGPTEKDPVIHPASEIMDLDEWPGDMQSLATFGQEQLNLLLQHFQDSLTRGGCDLDLIKTEWTDFKAYVYRHHTKYISKFVISDDLETDLEMFFYCWRFFLHFHCHLLSVNVAFQL